MVVALAAVASGERSEDGDDGASGIGRAVTQRILGKAGRVQHATGGDRGREDSSGLGDGERYARDLNGRVQDCIGSIGRDDQRDRGGPVARTRAGNGDPGG